MRSECSVLLLQVLLAVALHGALALIGEPVLQRAAKGRLGILAGLDQTESKIEFQGYEEGDDDDADDSHSFANHQGQEEYAQQSLLQIYVKDREWLAKATDIVLDHNHYPLGQLTVEDVDKIVVLMEGWVRQRSVNASLSVENLLKRVVDDMRANNHEVHVNSNMYALAIDAWSKCGANGSWDRAQHIHDAMVQVFNETGDDKLRPTTKTYNILIAAHGKRNCPEGLDQAEHLLQEMIHLGANETKPDCPTFNTLLDAYRKSTDKQRACERVPQLIQLMQQLDIKPSAYTYTVLQYVYSQSNLPRAAQKTLEVLNTMLEQYKTGALLSKPSCSNYNSVLRALSRSEDRNSSDIATALLHKMELPVSKGGFDVEPDRLSYALTILTCTRSNRVDDAERVLLNMEARAKEDEKKRKEISSAAPPKVVLDIECFNVVATALSKLRLADAVERIIAILGRMKQYTEEGYTHIAPNVRSWNALLNALARSKEKKAGERAEQIIRHMFETGDQKVKPNAFSFTAVLSAYQNSRVPADANRADEILREMEVYYEKGELDAPPDIFHYTIVANAWAKSGLPTSPQRVMQIVSHMNELAKRGNPALKPNARTYLALLDCVASIEPPGAVEGLLDHLMMLERNGENCLDAYCFSAVIDALCRANAQNSGRRAEAILDKAIEHSQVNPKCKVSSRTFTKIISYYRKSRTPDAPYRAEYILNRMIALYKEGRRELQPEGFAFGVVMDAYSGAKHPDSAITAERLLKQMTDLRVNHGATLSIDASVLYNVLYAWSISGDEDAGRRSEIHLDYMERRFEAGDIKLKPDSRSYGIVLNAWSKSNCFDKARRALNVLQRMEKQAKKGHKDLRPNEHCLSLVINACAFTNSGAEAEAEAFDIAVSIFDRMLSSRDCQPSSLTYGWYIQACGRLAASQQQKEAEIERAWTICCKKGLVNAFVLHRFTGSAPEPLYKKMMGPVLSKCDCGYETKELLRLQISPADLPKKWTANVRGESDNPSTDWWSS